MLLLCLSSCRDRIAYFPPPWIFDNPNGNEGTSDNEEALTGQWKGEIPSENPEDGSSLTFIIDIQSTKPGYWIMAYMDDESSNEALKGMAIESKRTQEDGWFFVSYGGTKIRYKFKDGDQDTLETVLEYEEEGKKIELELKRLNDPIEIIPVIIPDL